MKNKRCKVKFVDDLETDFEVKYAEIQTKCIYKIYAYSQGWILLDKKDTKQKALDYVDNIRNSYSDFIVIEHDFINDIDKPIMIKER